jgi:hypothetical protein
MASDEGGRWDVGAKNNAVLLVRVSEDNERLFEASLEPYEARALADLLTKFAAKAAGNTDDSKDTDDNEDTDDNQDKGDDEDDESSD